MIVDDEMTNQRLWTARQVADVLSVSVRTLQRLVADGAVEPLRIRGQMRFTPAEVARLVSEGTAA